MRAEERRAAIVRLLVCAERPVPGGELSRRCEVSRQIIVSDIAALKQNGYDIVATHNGYVMKQTPWKERVFRVCHTSERTEEELETIVSLGGRVEDVFVCHSVYGTISAKLHLFSRDDVKCFMENVRNGSSGELMRVTGGYHSHTVRADSEEILDRIAQALEAKGFSVSQESQNP